MMGVAKPLPGEGGEHRVEGGQSCSHFPHSPQSLLPPPPQLMRLVGKILIISPFLLLLPQVMKLVGTTKKQTLDC